MLCARPFPRWPAKLRPSSQACEDFHHSKNLFRRLAIKGSSPATKGRRAEMVFIIVKTLDRTSVIKGFSYAMNSWGAAMCLNTPAIIDAQLARDGCSSAIDDRRPATHLGTPAVIDPQLAIDDLKSVERHGRPAARLVMRRESLETAAAHHPPGGSLPAAWLRPPAGDQKRMASPALAPMARASLRLLRSARRPAKNGP